jgi:hypothetical protein
MQIDSYEQDLIDQISNGTVKTYTYDENRQIYRRLNAVHSEQSDKSVKDSTMKIC